MNGGDKIYAIKIAIKNGGIIKDGTRIVEPDPI